MNTGSRLGMASGLFIMFAARRCLLRSRFPLNVESSALTQSFSTLGEPMLDSISTTLSALHVTMDMVKRAIDVRDDRKIAEALSAVNDRIIAIQEACMRMQEQNSTLLQDQHALAYEKRELENEILRLRQQADKLSGYERARTPVGTIVFVETATKDAREGSVYACAACMDQGQISTLQPTPDQLKLHCPIHGFIQFALPHWIRGRRTMGEDSGEPL